MTDPGRMDRLLALGDPEAAREHLVRSRRRGDAAGIERARQILAESQRHIAVLATSEADVEAFFARLESRYPSAHIELPSEPGRPAPFPRLARYRIWGYLLTFYCCHEPESVDVLDACLLASEGTLVLLPEQPELRAWLWLEPLAAWALPGVLWMARSSPLGAALGSTLELQTLVGAEPAMVVDALLETVTPPQHGGTRQARDPTDGQPMERGGAEMEPFSGVVVARWAEVGDPLQHSSMVRVVTGAFDPQRPLVNTSRLFAHTQRWGRTLRSSATVRDHRVWPGDEGTGVGSLIELPSDRFDGLGETLCDRDGLVTWERMGWHQPLCTVRIQPPVDSGEEQRLRVFLEQLERERPGLQLLAHYRPWGEREEHDFEAFELRGLHPRHVRSALRRLRMLWQEEERGEIRHGGVEALCYVRLGGSYEARGRYVIQTGGSGHFGEVWLRFEEDRSAEPLRFINAVSADTIPTEYVPAVEHGLRAMLSSSEVGRPITGLRVTLFDGRFHLVDSRFRSYWVAAQRALQEAIERMPRTVLRPIMRVYVERPARGALQGFAPVEAAEGVVWEGTFPLEGAMALTDTLEAAGSATAMELAGWNEY